LPEPVAAAKATDEPASWGGMARVWIGVGERMEGPLLGFRRGSEREGMRLRADQEESDVESSGEERGELKGWRERAV